MATIDCLGFDWK